MEPIKIGKVLSEDFEGVKWTMRAASKEESRYHLQYLFSLGKHVVATDGHRLHAYRMMSVEVPKGSYMVMADKNQIVLVPQEAEAPKMMDVFPRKRKIVAKTNIRYERSGVSRTYTSLVRVMVAHQTVELKYVEDMVNGCDIGYFRYFGADLPIWMKNGRKQGLLMPMTF